MGVTVENIDVVHRIDNLRGTNAKIKFLSCEPLLSSLGKIDLDIDWLIAGGGQPQGSAHAWILGNGAARSVRRVWDSVLFQTMGWRSQEKSR